MTAIPIIDEIECVVYRPDAKRLSVHKCICKNEESYQGEMMEFGWGCSSRYSPVPQNSPAPQIALFFLWVRIPYIDSTTNKLELHLCGFAVIENELDVILFSINLLETI